MRPALSMAALALILAAGEAGAQDVTFYQYQNFGGQSFTAGDAVPDFANTGYNDRANSLAIRSGMWQVCTDANFHGQCVTLQPGQYRDLAQFGFSNNISSARPLGYAPTGAGAPVAGPGTPIAAPEIPGAQPGAQIAEPGARIAVPGMPLAAAANPGAPAVILFEDFQQAGRQFAVDGPIDNLDRRGFNDRARSMVVNAGRWELCRDAYYSGGCEVYGPGRYDAIGELSGELSSLRPVGGPPPQAAGYPPDWGHRVRAILYSASGFRGQNYVIGADVVRDLANTGFNDRAQSLRIEQGFWIFCSDADFGGICRTFGPGDYPNLPPGLDNAISSGRSISDDNPYPSAPNWRR